MRRLLLSLAALAALSLLAAAPAPAAFGLKGLDVTFTNENGSADAQAGSHPFAMTTTLAVDGAVHAEGYEAPDGEVRDFVIGQVPGLAGNPTATPRCTTAQFNTRSKGYPACPRSSAVGIVAIKGEFDAKILKPGEEFFVHAPVYNLVSPPGVAARLGFVALNVPITIDVGVDGPPRYNIVASLRNIPQAILFYGSELTLWGNPASPAHDPLRGECAGEIAGATEEPVSLGECPVVDVPEEPFLTLPRACTGPLTTSFKAESWQRGDLFEEAVFTHDDSEPPNPQGFLECGELLAGFAPSITAQPTSKAAQSPTGLDFTLDVEDKGITESTGLASSDIEQAVVTLPEGMTANPSLAAGLGVCTEEQLEAETAFSAPGAGCPNSSKIGTVEVETPLLDENVNGALYIAKPYENPFGTLLALYVVIRNPNLGIFVRQPLRVEPDPETGQLIAVAEDMPQLPFSHFRTHFREGGRSPLISPPSCGAHTVKAELTPWAGGAPVTTGSAFQILSGPDGGPCPPGGAAPFAPGFIAGSIDNSAASYSPFYMRLTRRDGEQDMTKFSSVLPPGVVGKIAGLARCPEAAIAAAKARTGPHGGQEELEAPSCPATSRIGSTLAGAGAGSQLTYVPGTLYLAGPVGGDPLSVVAIVPALAGPFDAGTVVVREALTLNPAHRRSGSRRRKLGPDPPHPQGHPAERQGPARLRRQARLHPQPDLMRTLPGQGDPVRLQPLAARPRR